MGHVMKSVWVTSEAGCEANCFAEDDCMSINFGPKSQEKHLCELSSSDHNLHPEDLKERSSFTYTSMWVSVIAGFHAHTIKNKNKIKIKGSVQKQHDTWIL